MKPSIQGYEVGDRLGEGGMALVFRAWSHERRDFAVIKLLSPEVEESPMLRQRWDTEAQLGRWLDHPSIARILDAGRDAHGQSYLAMEYVSGQTLAAIHRELLGRQRRFPPHLAMAVSEAVLGALEFVHRARNPETSRPLGIVHRDLKPANVMITYDGVVKVLDFGVARVDLGKLRTQTGMLTGTPAYMSPEQVLADKRIDLRSDIYSWAAVVYELLRGEPLVGDYEDRLEQLKAVVIEPPPTIREHVPELKSSDVDHVLATALEKEPENRFASAAEFWLRLEKAGATDLGIGTPEELGRLVRSLFPGGLEKERLLRAMPRAWSAPLTDVVPSASRESTPSAVRPQPLDDRPNDSGPLPPSPIEVPPALPGYAIKGRLGEGGSGVVFLVEHEATGTLRALKVLRPELAGNPDIRRRFATEAQLGHRIAHPGVVRVFEVGEDPEGRPFMVMERIEGQDLAEWLRRLDRAGRRMPPEAALRISLDVLECLDYVHSLQGPSGSLGIVHRDLKPSNVMVTPDGQVKVLDFGIARAWLGQTRTRTGYRSGTELYMSPEQALARKDLDHRSDIYSWAVVLYELLTGTPLIRAEAAVEILPSIVQTPARELLAPLEGVAPRLRVPLERALAKQPADRFPSASAFATDLAAAAPELVGLGNEALGRMWKAEPPVGPAHGRPSGPEPSLNPAVDPAEAPTGGLPLLPGYVVRKKLDEGGCGELWLATKSGDTQWWVIKTLRADLVHRPQVVQRFEREVRILAELDHPHVVRVHGARRTEQGQLFTVMEYIRGLDFEQVLYFFRAQDRLLPTDVSLRIMLDVLSGLHAAHQLSDGDRPIGVVHRDLSPRNLMIDADGTTKVIDFGLAAAQLSPVPRQTRADVGTPRFWSPEQARGQLGIDRRSDVYAAGIILYEALTGRAGSPFAGLEEVRRSVMHDHPPPARTVVPSLPEALSQAVQRAISKNPDDRFASAAAFGAALEHAWGRRALRSHSEVAAFLRRDGPHAYREAADRSPVAMERLAPAPLRAQTNEGRPSDLLQDALHPPTRHGEATPPPRRRGQWVLAASGAAMVAIVVALSMSVEPPKPSVNGPETAVKPGSIEPTATVPAASPPITSPILTPVEASVPEPGRPFIEPLSAARGRARDSARPGRVKAGPSRKDRGSQTATAPPREPTTSGAEPPAPPPSKIPVLDRIRRDARNKMEASAMLRAAARDAETAGRLTAEERADIEVCLARRFMAARERLIRECGAPLQR